MLRRDADCIYWTGRYIERAEATARMIDVHYHFSLQSQHHGDTAGWDSILEISGLEDDFRSRYSSETELDVLHFFCFDLENPSSIASCLRQARENARSIRDQISSEMWECVNHTYLDIREWDVERVLKASPFTFFRKVKDSSHLFQGITARTLMMGEVRHFYDAGRYLERADQTARILDVRYRDLVDQTSESQADLQGWVAVLKSVGAYEAYCKTFHDGLAPTNVVEFLVFSDQFPASIRHSIQEVDAALRRVSGNSALSPSNPPERAAGKLFAELTYMDAEEIFHKGLHEFLDEVEIRCSDIGDAIWNTYLSY